METGLKHTSTLVVDTSKTAEAMRSGDMPVLATPVMVALMENAAMLAVKDALPEGATTVGGHINVSHVKPTGLGQEVSAVAADQGESLIGEGEHVRFIVDRERFLAKV